MKLYIKETNEEKTLTMREWNGTQWNNDFFNDAECNIVDGSTVTAEQYSEIVEYWESEVNR